MWRQRPVNDKIYNIKFVNKPIKFLGIYVGEHETACNEENWNEKILKIEKILASGTVSPKINKRLNNYFMVLFGVNATE